MTPGLASLAAKPAALATALRHPALWATDGQARTFSNRCEPWGQRLLCRICPADRLLRGEPPRALAGFSRHRGLRLVSHELDRAADFRRVFGSARPLVVLAPRGRRDYDGRVVGRPLDEPVHAPGAARAGRARLR